VVTALAELYPDALTPEQALAENADLHGFVANQGDAWRYTQDYLKRFLDNCLQQPEMVRKADEIHGLYRIFATTLGRRTGELHRTLAQISGDPAFDPEPITAADLTRWLNRIRGEAIATFERLAQQRESLPESAWPRVDRLLAARGALLASLKQTATLNPGTVKIRYHGDYHLGQVLVAKDDVIIIDFEGEPSRTLEERRDKHSPLRDVVGMVRSFNYAAHAALRPFAADSRMLLAPRIDDWERQTRVAFLNGYAEATRDSVGLGIDLAQANPLLQAFTLEKVCYELRYELDNRPDWVEIPLSGLCELLPLLDQPFPRINLL
jgi:maltose alpha-D-glucosyltransferase/alpha-amylase